VRASERASETHLTHVGDELFCRAHFRTVERGLSQVALRFAQTRGVPFHAAIVMHLLRLTAARAGA